MFLDEGSKTSDARIERDVGVLFIECSVELLELAHPLDHIVTTREKFEIADSWHDEDEVDVLSHQYVLDETMIDTKTFSDIIVKEANPFQILDCQTNEFSFTIRVFVIRSKVHQQ